MVWSGVGGTPSDPRRKAWRVRIFLRDSIRSMDFIDTAEPHLADALLLAVEEAEKRGWARAATSNEARGGRT